MKIYTVLIKDSALHDIDDIADEILNISKSIYIAEKYIDGLNAEIQKLSIHGASLPFCDNKNITEIYGKCIRRVNYKKIAILFYIANDTVLIQEIKFQHTVI